MPLLFSNLSNASSALEIEAIEKVAARLNLDYCDLDDEAVAGRFQTSELGQRIDAGICWDHKLVPLYEEENCLVVAFANPLDQEARQKLQFSLAKPIRAVIAEEGKIMRLLEANIPRPRAAEINPFDDMEAGLGPDEIEVLSGSSKETEVRATQAELPPIIKLCNKIMFDAAKADASDIHIEPTHKGLDVRFRIDGVMHYMFEIPRRLQPYVLSRFKLSAEMDIAEKRRPQDGRLRVRVGDELIDMRVSSIPIAAGEKLVLRLLRAGDKLRSLAQLGYPKPLEAALLAALDRSGKLILVTGPTGHGKTTTLYACLSHLKDGTTNIETVEDPIEYRIPGINQVQVNETIGVDFTSALRSILRQDPDVIMIGEIRDKETADIALQAAQTGHLVLSTLHTNNAPAAISRLITLGVDPYLLASSLGGVLAQRLVRAICLNCCGEADDAYIEKQEPLLKAYNVKAKALRKGKGCPRCNFTGYKGRIGIFSFLSVTPDVAEAVHRKASIPEIAAAARGSGFTGLDVAAVELVKAGVTTFDEVRGHLSAEDYQDVGGDLDQKKQTENNSSAADTAAAAPDQNRPVQQQPMQPAMMPQPVYMPQPQMAPVMPVYGYPAQPVPMPVNPYMPQQPMPGMVPPGYVQPMPPPAAPYGYQQPYAPPVPPPAHAQPAQGVPIARPRVLLIEDEPDLRQLFSTILQGEMYDVIIAGNGQEGLQMVYNYQPNIVVCDLQMPVMNGKEFLQRLKSNKQTKGIPVVILTNSDTDDNEIDLLELGASDFVGKSESHKVMLTRVRKLLNNG